jgi:hypothetical protein
MALLSRKILEGYRSRISTKLGDSGGILGSWPQAHEKDGHVDWVARAGSYRVSKPPAASRLAPAFAASYGTTPRAIGIGGIAGPGPLTA